MVIEAGAGIFSRAAWAYIQDGIIEVNLPEWSGRMDKTYALAELARLKRFVEKVESALSDTSVPAQRDTDTPSERAQVVESAVAEDEAADDDEDAVTAINRRFEEAMYDDGFYAWDDEDDWLDWEEWAEAHYTPPPPQCLNHAGRRSYHKDIRRHALMFRETKLYNAYCLMPDVATFEGNVYRIINPADFNYDGIPF